MNDDTPTPTPPPAEPNPTPPVPMDPIRPPQPAPPSAPPAPAPTAPVVEPTPPAAPPTPPAPAPAVAPPTPPAPAPAAPAIATSPDVAKSEELTKILTPVPVPVPVDEPVPTQSALGKAGSGFMILLTGIFSWIVFPLAVVLFLHFFVFQAFHVLGTSMNPTLDQADYLIISKVGYTEAMVGRLFHHNDLYLPKRGQIVVFHYPKDPSEIFVKRVIGEPGDRVVVKDGAVTLYTKDKPQGYNPDAGYEPSGTTTLIDTDEVVQPGNVFVMGDNRTPGGSYDSREWGELPSSYIIGNAVLRLLPLDAVKVL